MHAARLAMPDSLPEKIPLEDGPVPIDMGLDRRPGDCRSIGHAVR